MIEEHAVSEDFAELPRGIRELCQSYLNHMAIERGAAYSTLRSYTRDLIRYGRYLALRGITRIVDVRSLDVVGFLAALRDGDEEYRGLAESSVARALIAARGLHRFALTEGIVEVDVAAEVSPPAPPLRLPKALPVGDVLRLLEQAGDHTVSGLRDRALVEVLYSCGARISEITGMDVDDVSAEQRTVRLNGKGGRQRIVPIGRPALEALDAYLVRARPELARHGRGTPAVFLNSRGTRLSRQTAWHGLKSAARRAGLSETISPHTLRHSFATHLIEGGADVRVVQELLGHASVTTTQIYTLITVNTLREVYVGAHPRALG